MAVIMSGFMVCMYCIPGSGGSLILPEWGMVGAWSLLGVVFYVVCKRKYKESFGDLVEMCIRDRCYFPANKDIQADDKFDNTQFFYRFIRQCQQIFAEKKVLSVIFQRDLYITLVAKMPTGTERENVIQQIKTFSESFARQKELYMAVGDEETVVENLWEKYRDLSYLCRWGRQKGKNICQEEEMCIRDR